MPWGTQTVTCKATSTPRPPSLEGQCLSPPLLLFSLSHSPLSIWGGRRRTRCKSPVPRGWHASLPPRPPTSLASTAAHSQAAGSLATLACTRLPHGAPQHTHFLPAVCMGRARSHLLSPAPSHRREPLTHRAPCLPASGQMLNWEEVILNIWGAHLRVGSGPHGAWRKWQHMQLCHFLRGGCSGGGSTEQQQAFLGHNPGLGWGRLGASVDSEPGAQGRGRRDSRQSWAAAPRGKERQRQ